MRIYFLLAVLLFSVSVGAQKKNVLKINDLCSENYSDPLGMDAVHPGFSWKLSSSQEGAPWPAAKWIEPEKEVSPFNDNNQLKNKA